MSLSSTERTLMKCVHQQNPVSCKSGTGSSEETGLVGWKEWTLTQHIHECCSHGPFNITFL